MSIFIDNYDHGTGLLNMGTVQLENTPISKLEILFAADSHTRQSEVHVASPPTVLHISWCAAISVWPVHIPAWFCWSPTANHEMWQEVASCLHFLTSCVLHDIRSMKMHSRSRYVKMARVLVMLSLHIDHANTRLQMNNVMYVNHEPNSNPLYEPVLRGQRHSWWWKHRQTVLSLALVSGTAFCGEHCTGLKEHWTPVKLRYFQNCSTIGAHVDVVGSPKVVAEEGMLRPYDDVVHGNQRHTCHCPHQHKYEPSTVAEWRGMLVSDAESERLEHLLPGTVH